jgi:hypothetical protein
MSLLHDITDVMISESLDSPLEIVKGKSKFETEEDVESLLAARGAKSITIYHTVDHTPEIEFYRFLYKGKWEVHFNNVSAGFRIGNLSDYDGHVALRILATVVDLYKTKIDKSQGIRIFAAIPELQRIAIAYLRRNLPKDIYTYREVKNFREIGGTLIPLVYEVTRDSRSLRLTQEKYIEDINVSP